MRTTSNAKLWMINFILELSTSAVLLPGFRGGPEYKLEMEYHSSSGVSKVPEHSFDSMAKGPSQLQGLKNAEEHW